MYHYNNIFPLIYFDCFLCFFYYLNYITAAWIAAPKQICLGIVHVTSHLENRSSPMNEARDLKMGIQSPST